MTSPFDLSGPSIFADDKRFVRNKKGRSASETATKGVDTHRKATGVCKGTISGLSAKADRQRKGWAKDKRP